MCVSRIHAQNDARAHAHTYTRSILFYPSPDWHNTPGSLKWLIWQGVFDWLVGCKSCANYYYCGHWFYQLSYVLGCFVWRLIKFLANRKSVLPQSLLLHNLWVFHSSHSSLFWIFVATMLVYKINFYVSNINSLWFMTFGNVSKFFAKI